MALSFEACVSILKEHLSADESSRGVVYAADTPISAGQRLRFGRVAFEVTWSAHLAFVDREPLANWAHSCRYVLINRETGELVSHEARLPPFHTGANLQWRVAYKAEGVPDNALLAVP
ncbi:MAG TPA: hypothetical protein VKF41_04495 [Bryobacteraceae bacterium]|nr:hypothetical protein [Bryobacteraceae bacterium]